MMNHSIENQYYKFHESLKRYCFPIFLILSLVFSSIFIFPQSQKDRINNIQPLLKTVISVTQLESSGFGYIYDNCFDLLFTQKALYLLNSRDRMIVKFSNQQPIKILKIEKGVDERKMMFPVNIILYDPKTIAVFDFEKRSVLFYDMELHFIKEQKVKGNIIGISNNEGDTTVFLLNSNFLLGQMDKSLNIVGTYIREYEKTPFRSYYKRLLNQIFFMTGGLVGHTKWLQFEKQCKFDIYDMKKKKRIIRLSWEQPFKLNEINFLAKRDLYATNNAVIAGGYYIIQNAIQRSIEERVVYELLVFDMRGKLVFRGEIPYGLIRFKKGWRDNFLYMMNDEGSIVALDVNELLKTKPRTLIFKDSTPIKSKPITVDEVEHDVIMDCEWFCCRFNDIRDVIACMTGCIGGSKFKEKK